MPGCRNDCRDRSLDLPARLAPWVDNHRPREPRTPPSTPRPPAIRGPTPSVSVGPDPLGLAVPRLDRLALQPRHRATRHRPRLAPPRLPALLAFEVQGLSLPFNPFRCSEDRLRPF